MGTFSASSRDYGVQVQIGHSPVPGVSIVVDLANTAPALSGGQDEISDSAGLLTFVDSHFLFGTEVTTADLALIRGIRDRICTVLQGKNMKIAATELNQLAASARATPRLRCYDGIDWQIDWHIDGVSFPDRLAAQLAAGLMEHLVQHDFSRLGTCEAEDCQRWFVDRTRNHSKRFCDGRNCGGRAHARAYRRRHLGQPRSST